MMVTLAIVRGFQYEVREKIIGFGAHIQVMKSGGASIIESEPMLLDTQIAKKIHAVKGVKNVQAIAYKTAIFQSKKDSVFYQNINGLDTFQVQQEIKGVLFKGVDSTYNWQFFKNALVAGRLPKYTATTSNEILISKKVASQLHYELNERVGAYFVQQKPIKRNFTIVGIFETGLDNFDDDIVLADLRIVQQYSAWGIKTSLRVEDSLYNGGIVIKASSMGGNGNYKYNWKDGYEVASKLLLFPQKDTLIRVVASDYFANPYANEAETTLPDTAYVKIHFSDFSSKDTADFLPSDATIHRVFLNATGTKYAFNYFGKKVVVELIDGKGSSSNYISGYEVSVDDWAHLKMTDTALQKSLFFWSMENKKPIQIRSITKIYSSIFSWLSFLDVNFLIIIVMMVLISIITMGAALLVLILEQTAMIGTLKSMGANNWLIRKIFLIQAGFLILKGLFWGNLIGISICFLQAKFNIIPLDPAVYYLSAVPVKFDLMQILLLNAGTLLVCVIALLLPSYFITRISPVKALKYE